MEFGHETPNVASNEIHKFRVCALIPEGPYKRIRRLIHRVSRRKTRSVFSGTKHLQENSQVIIFQAVPDKEGAIVDKAILYAPGNRAGFMYFPHAHHKINVVLVSEN